MNDLDTLWMLVAAVLVFFMQAGFAMVEAGFTRAKNANNIIMKNLMDFSVGSVLFFIAGYGLMYGESWGGVIGTTGFLDPVAKGIAVPVEVIFQTVFCATAATIVSQPLKSVKLQVSLILLDQQQFTQLVVGQHLLVLQS